MNKNQYSNISNRVMETRDELVRVQEQFFASPYNTDLCNKEKDLVHKYVELRTAEESFIRQRSRVKWLALGDQNTRFFHQKMCMRRVRNSILSLQDENGVIIEDSGAIKENILNYYIGLLGTESDGRIDARTQLQQAIRSQVSSSDQELLIRPVIGDEIRKALWSINGDKAPGPAGYNSMFYQRNWEVVGQDLIDAVTAFFANGYILKEWNATAISLVPKVSSPSTVRDYCPISCCNVSFKCITKVLASRLQSVLPYLISQT